MSIPRNIHIPSPTATKLPQGVGAGKTLAGDTTSPMCHPSPARGGWHQGGAGSSRRRCTAWNIPGQVQDIQGCDDTLGCPTGTVWCTHSPHHGNVTRLKDFFRGIIKLFQIKQAHYLLAQKVHKEQVSFSSQQDETQPGDTARVPQMRPSSTHTTAHLYFITLSVIEL